MIYLSPSLTGCRSQVQFSTSLYQYLSPFVSYQLRYSHLIYHNSLRAMLPLSLFSTHAHKAKKLGIYETKNSILLCLM